MSSVRFALRAFNISLARAEDRWELQARGDGGVEMPTVEFEQRRRQFRLQILDWHHDKFLGTGQCANPLFCKAGFFQVKVPESAV